MFVTVLFGDSRMELFNLNCKLINFINDLKKRCGLDVKDCVDLMDDRSGAVMRLGESEQSAELAGSLLMERSTYVVLRVCSCDDEVEGRKYVSVLNDLSKSHPELTEILDRMSNPSKERDRRGGSLRRSWSQKETSVTQPRNKSISGNRKNHQNR